MPSAPDQQLTLNFEPALPEKYRTLRDFLAYRVQVQQKPAKTIAMDMDMSPSTLSRKLTPSDGDTQRFNVDDLEAYISVTKDTTPIEYLAAKYLQSDASRQARAIARVEALAMEMGNALAALKQLEPA
jgi:hypothetical protein